MGKMWIILLDEYDTPMQEAYVKGYWHELTDYIRNLFNETFKNNPYLERAIMTGITRISRESIFFGFKPSGGCDNHFRRSTRINSDLRKRKWNRHWKNTA